MIEARLSSFRASMRRLRKDAPDLPFDTLLECAARIVWCTMVGHSKKRRQWPDGTPICDRCSSDKVDGRR